MASDEERREVARRLRELRSGWSSGECYYAIIHALGLPDTSREDGGAALYVRLADLIEPSCDSDALLALADNLESSASMLLKQNDLDPNRKRRGMSRDHAQSLMAASGRIREALGVE